MALPPLGAAGRQRKDCKDGPWREGKKGKKAMALAAWWYMEKSLAHPQPQVDHAGRQQHGEEQSFPLASGGTLVLQGTQTPSDHTQLQRDQQQTGKLGSSGEAHGLPVGKCMKLE